MIAFRDGIAPCVWRFSVPVLEAILHSLLPLRRRYTKSIADHHSAWGLGVSNALFRYTHAVLTAKSDFADNHVLTMTLAGRTLLLQ